jgi:hypothetical protein
LLKRDAEKILISLDGLAAYLETIRNLVISQIEEEAVTSKQRILDLMPDEECLHLNAMKLETLGESSMMCDDCGKQF